MDTIGSKNVNNAPIHSSGGVNIGDKIEIGSITINLLEAKQYIDLQEQLSKLNARFEKTNEKVIQYPKDDYFKQELYAIDKERDEVNSSLESLKREVISLAEIFSKITINTNNLRLAKEYFEAGDFQQARNVLDIKELDSELNALLEEKDKLESKVANNKEMLQYKADEYLILARLTSIDYSSPTRLIDTRLYYEKSILAFPNKSNIFAFANFLLERNQHKEALDLFNDLLKLYEQPIGSQSGTYQRDWLATLNNRAILFDKTGQIDEAMKSYIKCLEVLRKLNNEYPNKFLPDIAATCLNFGNFLERTKSLEAEKYYEESLEIREALMAEDPDTYSLDIISSLVGLGIFCANNDKYDIAEKSYKRAFELCYRLVSANPYVIYPLLSVTFINWINFQIIYLNEEFDSVEPGVLRLDLVYKRGAVEDAINRALAIQNMLCKIDLDMHSPAMVSIYLNRGLFYTYVSPDREQALSAASEAIRYATPFADTIADCKGGIVTAKYIIDAWNN
jgi:tetratricopeptide (TPR) repeat protein